VDNHAHLVAQVNLGIAYSDNTKEERAQEEEEGVGKGDQAQLMTRHKKLPNAPYFMNMSE
jgi:hypothetical protein